MKSLSNNAESFTPEKDVNETTPDGRTIQVAVAGVPLPMAEARKLGLLENEKPAQQSSKTTGADAGELKKAQADLKKANDEIEKLKKQLADEKEKSKKPAESKPNAPTENK